MSWQFSKWATLLFADKKECLDYYMDIQRMYNNDLPFSLAHTGVCFRQSENESHNFLFDARELTNLVTFNFCRTQSSVQQFDQLVTSRLMWWRKFAENPSSFTESVSKEEDNSIHIQYEFPWGRDSVEIIRNHGSNFLESCNPDLKEQISSNPHQKHYNGNGSFLPSVIECNMFLEGGMLAYLLDAYTEKKTFSLDSGSGDESKATRTVLQLHPAFAPYNVSIAVTENGDPTLRLVIKHITKEIHDANILSLDVSSNANPLENQFVRNDELGIPFSVVIDKSTIDMACIGVRHRDSTLKEKIHITEIKDYIKRQIQSQ
ncbi:DNA polymerase subunit gamma-2, mitochondrial-like isoform X2 [Ostrea edulis]|uniref:DNA polymerase subunit gamma-2, mitochondrial-like isoform X2 n=1 Tax=Ostrea edulis TaxID=37623 RepID=UPI0024AF23EB|nr:DNA polymerase subunit gamma-2, mitochondrial-like isoform X2 [Ostrea edulis]